MTSTATMLEESILATQQQKSAADQVDTAIQQIREAADQLAAEQTQWAATAERLERWWRTSTAPSSPTTGGPQRGDHRKRVTNANSPAE